MDRVKSIWLLLSPNAVLCCNEPSRPEKAGTGFMSLQLFAEILRLAKERLWSCMVLGDENGVPQAYQELADEI